MKIPQIVPFINEEEYEAVKSCFDNRWLTEGPKTKEFGEKLLELIGSKYGVFAPNGTLALYLGLKATGIGPGDEVIVPDFTFIASATSVIMTGAKPVFVDVNSKNFQIDITQASKLINKHTKAIMPVHMYGTMCEMDPIIEFAKKYNLLIIEDAAEAVGVRHKGKHAGTFGKVGCFSFFADKTITIGEGGFVCTDDAQTYDNLLYLRNQGRKDRGSFIHPQIGYNFRITDLQSAVGLVQLKKLPQIIEAKQSVLGFYRKYLSDIPDVAMFTPPQGYAWIPFRVGILTSDAKELMKLMEDKGVQTRSFFYPLHRQPAFKGIGRFSDEDFPNSIYGYDCGICLPTYPTLSRKEIKFICDIVRQYYSQRREIFYKYYDKIFSQKDYLTETKFLFDEAEDHGIGADKILEIGCGTGNHTKELLRHNGVKQLVAVDIDTQMIAKIKEKLGKEKSLAIVHGRVSDIPENGFSLATAMFNVVTYAASQDDLVDLFNAVFDKLKPGGMFIFDAWNGVAAIKDPPQTKNDSIALSKGKRIDVTLNPEIDVLNQHVALEYNLRVSLKGKITESGTFKIDQYLWTPMQLSYIYKKLGFVEQGVYALNDLERKATETDWKILFVLKKPL